MVFEKIANKITKHYKLVIVLWIVALLASVPAMLQINSAVQYDTGFGSVDGYESMQAQDIINKNFQTSVANGTLIILLQADNITDAQARDFVLALQERIRTSPDMKYLENVTSVYTYSEYVLDQAILQMGPALRPAQENLTMGAFLIWGIPMVHVANWTESHNDTQAYIATQSFLQYYLQQIHADANVTMMVLGYYEGFANAWNALPMIADPMVRATTAVDNVAPTFIQTISAQSPQMGAMLNGVYHNLNLTTFDDEATIHAMTLSMVGGMAGITNMTFLQEVYDLGPAYQPAAVNSYVQGIVANNTLSTYPMAMPSQLVSNFVSSNNKTMLMMVTFSVASDFVEKNGDKPLMDDVKALRADIKSLKASTGATITTYVTGDAAISADMQESSESDMSMIEPVTIVIIIVLMGILFRSVLGQFLPLGAVGVAIGMSQALVFVIGSTIAQINYTVLTMLFAILMGVGTDYSIFLMTRYREERIRGANRERAVHVAITWAGESIVTSGATVIIAFFAMALSSFSFVQTMGLVLGLSIIIALLVALTLVPAILMLVGNRIFWPTTGKRFEKFAKNLMDRKKKGNHGYFHRAATFSVDHAKVVVLVAILVSIPTTYIFVSEPTSFDFIGSMGDSEGIQGMNAMADDFGAGKIMPTQVVMVADFAIYNGTGFDKAYLDAVENVSARIAADDHMVKSVTSITRPFGEASPVDYANYTALPAATKAAMVSALGKDNRSVLFTVVLNQEPQSADAVAYMGTLRGEMAQERSQQLILSNSTILVGGSTAMMRDMSLDTSAQFANIEVLVVVGIFIVLMIVLGSILLSAFAVISIAMSISWAFAATTLVFGDLLGKPVLWMIPLILFVMLMGIGMDYNVFILTRIREEAHKGKDTKTAVVDAVDWTGGIITALALIMAGAFGSIMLSSNAMLQEFGFALCVAVLLDAMVVRTYIVPAAITVMGKWAWWAPGRLQRVGREEKMEAKNGRQKTD